MLDACRGQTTIFNSNEYVIDHPITFLSFNRITIKTSFNKEPINILLTFYMLANKF